MEIEVDTHGISGEQLDFVQILDMFKTILRLRSLEELALPPASAAASPPAASSAGACVPDPSGASVPASSGDDASPGLNAGSEGVDQWAAEHLTVVDTVLRMVKSCHVCRAKLSRN